MSASCWPAGIVLLCVRIASSVVWLLQYLLLRRRMSLSSLEGLVLKEIVPSVCFRLFSCSHLISSSITSFSVCVGSSIYCEGGCDLMCSRC